VNLSAIWSLFPSMY